MKKQLSLLVPTLCSAQALANEPQTVSDCKRKYLDINKYMQCAERVRETSRAKEKAERDAFIANMTEKEQTAMLNGCKASVPDEYKADNFVYQNALRVCLMNTIDKEMRSQ